MNSSGDHDFLGFLNFVSESNQQVDVQTVHFYCFHLTWPVHLLFMYIFLIIFSLFSVWDFVWWRGSGRRDIPQTDLPHDLVWQGEAVFLSQTWPILRPCKVRIPCTGTWYSKARLSSCIVTWYVKAGLLYLMTWCGRGCLLNCDLLCHGKAALSHDLVWQSNTAFLWPSVARWLIFYDLVQQDETALSNDLVWWRWVKSVGWGAGIAQW